jgi:uncharacterized protein
MKYLILATVMLPAALGAQRDTTRLRWVPNPRTTNGSWVSDPARHLAAGTVAAMNSTIATLERETTAEMAVVVIDSLDGLEPGDAAFLLHRRWGVGKRERDNGLVLLWSPKLRKIHVSVGYGLEGVLPDARAGRIQDESMLPAFRSGDFDGGMLAGVRALAAAAREETYTGLKRAVAGSRAPGPRDAGHESQGSFIGLLFGIPLMLVAAALFVRHRPRRCPKGHGSMRRLGEREDNAYLENEAVLEERLGSMNYDVWLCSKCDERLVIPNRKWFTRFEKCPKCKRRTCERKTKTLKRATTTSTGERLVTRTCKNCEFTDSQTETIPRVTESSSGSGGSWSSGGGGGGAGSSFGGGSSGGGGAGRSY